MDNINFNFEKFVKGLDSDQDLNRARKSPTNKVAELDPRRRLIALYRERLANRIFYA